MSHIKLLSVALGLAACLALPVCARADTVDLSTSDGPMRLHIRFDGQVEGVYPKLHGMMFGQLGQDGQITGVWTQPRSDHPCSEMRGSTYAWGEFRIVNINSQAPDGFWGYCGERPMRDWVIERR